MEVRNMRDIKLNKTTIEIIVGIHCFFNDPSKVFLWLTTQNPNFGGCKPATLINIGKGKKVLAFIEAADKGE